MDENPQPTPEEISRWAIEYLRETVREKKEARELRGQKITIWTRFGKWWIAYGASIATMFTIISVPVGAFWTVKLYVDQREKERQQQQADAELRKQTLVVQFASELGDKSKRNGAAYALAVLAKQDSLSILKAHLKASAKSPEDAAFRDAIIDALVTIGPASFAPMIEMNRQARLDSEKFDDATAVIEATQTVILRLIRTEPTYLSQQKIDFSGVSFHRGDLAFLNLAGLNFAKAHFVDSNLCNVDLHGANLTEATFSGTSLMGVNLEGANIEKADFSGGLTSTSMDGVNLKKATGVEVDFSDADMSNAQLQGAILTKSNFTRATLESADFSNASLSDASFSKANLFGSKFIAAQLTSVNFQAANLQTADFSEANLQDARFFYFADDKPRAPNDKAPNAAALVDDSRFYSAKNIASNLRTYLCRWGATSVPDGCEGISREKFDYRYQPLGFATSCW